MSQNSSETDDADTGPLFLRILPMSFGQEKQTVSFSGMISAFLLKNYATNLQSSHFSFAFNYSSSYWKEKYGLEEFMGAKRADLFYLFLH